MTSAASGESSVAVAARYYPATGAANAINAQLSSDPEAGTLWLTFDGDSGREPEPRRIALSDIKVSERFSRATRNVQLADGSVLEIDNGKQLSRVMAAAGKPDARVTRWQHSWRMVTASLLISIILIAAAYIWLLPVAANQIARRVPTSWTEALDTVVIGQLKAQDSLQSTALTAQEQERLSARFVAVVASVPNAPKVKVYFFKMGSLPNAFALPGGSIVFLDGLVKLAPDDDALVGVFAHELGHVQHRHGLQILLRTAVISGVAAWYFGDFTTLANAAIVASQLKYSRDFETEADDTAIELMRTNRIDTKPLVTLFRRMRDHGEADASAAPEKKSDAAGDAATPAPHDHKAKGLFSIPEFLSTHPDIDRRIERFSAASKTP